MGHRLHALLRDLQAAGEHAMDDELSAAAEAETQERSPPLQPLDDAARKRLRESSRVRQEHAQDNGLADGHGGDRPVDHARPQAPYDVFEVGELRHGV